MILKPRLRAVALWTCAVLVGGVFVAVPEAAVAESSAPTVETPVYDDPIPGSPLEAISQDSVQEASSQSIALPEPQDMLGASSNEIVLAPAGGEDTVTINATGDEAAAVVGGWLPIGDTELEIASALPVDEVLTESDSPSAPPTVAIEVLSSKDAKDMGVDGLAITLSPVDDAVQSEPVAMRVPSELLDDMFGGDYASRVEWVEVPLADADENLFAGAELVPSAQTEEGLVLSPQLRSGGTLLVARAGSSSATGTGSYSSTPLKASSTWDVAEQTGAFTWSYDIKTPVPGAGPAPSVGLSYNSQAVDGLTASTNNQPSVVGEGWELAGSGFIERSYIPCAKDDGASGSVATSGDLCWRTDNATVSMAGRSGALIKDTTSGAWKLQNDDGTRFERLVGTAQGCADNGTSSTDCWRMTTTDGTQYYFGLNKLPGWSTGKPTTNSTWTVPVFGNDPGEPCHASTFAASSCSQAWRWNLDYIVDVHGNAQTLYYTAESNKYAKNGTGAAPYQRGGVVSRIEYGLRADALFATKSAGYRVLFTYDSKGRCNGTGATCTTTPLDGAITPSNPAAYPDVPFDRLCTAASCSASQIAPSFFTNARLAKVEAQAKVAGEYATADSWVLSHSYPDPGDGTSAALWLTQIQRTGTAAGQSAIAEPPTVFSGVTMQNRVWVIDGLAPLDKWRLSSIKTSLGAVLSVNYQGQQCTAAQASAILADLANNTRWCFPEWWVPQSTIPLGGRQDLFHKYPVASIAVDSRTGGPLSQVQSTQYIYGTPRWRYNDSPLTIANSRTWNVFSGVDTVEVREGTPATPAAQKVTKYTYYQGMNGDRATASGGAKSVAVAGTSIPDERWFAGQVHRVQTLIGAGGAVLSDQTSTPWSSGVKANDGTRQARMVRTEKTVLTEPLSTGGTRTLETRTTFDSTYGYPTTVSTIPSDATGRCTSTSYAAANTSAWIVGLPSEVRVVNTSCATLSAAQFPRDLVSDTKTLYDGLAWGAAPSKGLATSMQVVDRYEAGSAHWANSGATTYDSMGRPLVRTDALGRTTSTQYSPAASQPLLSTVTTNTAPFSWPTETTFEPTTGATTKVVDPNGSVTTISVDALGRTSKVWLPLRPQASNPSSPSMAYTYTLSQTSPNAVKTETLTGGGVVTKYELFDGLARSTQTQSLATGGGAVIKTTNYDHQGRVYFVDNEYWTSSITPGTAFFTPTSENNIPSQLVSTFDAAGRNLTSTLKTTGSVHSQTVNTYLGADRVDTIPPAGGTTSSVFKNTLGQKVRLVQYLTASTSGAGQATTFSYDGADRMTKMTDPAGNDWTWSFDTLGNQVAQDDADSGQTTATYDLAGNKTSTTDARGVTVTTAYDALNRRISTFAGDASGALLSSWTYDTVKRGLPSTSVSYTGSTPGAPGLAYTTSFGAYDAAGNVLEKTLSVPAGAPAFAGTSYKTTLYYNPDSSLQAKSLPAMGGLPAEIIRYSYDAWGRLSGIRGSSIVLANTNYTPIGQLSQFNRANGSTSSGYSTYGYDPATGAVVAIKDNAVFAGAGHYVADRTFTRDGAGNVTSATMNSVLPVNGTQKVCYQHDGLRQLTRAWTPSASSSCAATPSASLMGGLEPYWHDYSYDNQTGNRTGVVRKTASGTSSASTYEYSAPGDPRPHAVTSVTGPASAGPGSYQYDEAGNMTGTPDQEIAFNEVGKVVGVDFGSDSQATVYDVDGKMLLQTNTADGSSLVVGDTVLKQAPSSSVIEGYRTYSGTEGKPVAQRSAKTGTTGTVITWLFSNLEGTVDVQTVSLTGETTRMLRDPFGSPIGSTGVWANGTAYMNMPATASTGLTTVGARTYDPNLGKFISVDPIIDPNLPQQNTGYAYAGNNPTTYVDPTGLRLEGVGCGGCRTLGKGVVSPAARPGERNIPRTDLGLTRERELIRQQNVIEERNPGFEDRFVAAYYDTDYRLAKNSQIDAQIANYVESIGLECTAGPHAMTICHHGSYKDLFPQSDGTTIGDYFITPMTLRRALSAEKRDLLHHESIHAAQWAAISDLGKGSIWSGTEYGSLYGGFSLRSEVFSGNYGCVNYFEVAAGLRAGNYDSC